MKFARILESGYGADNQANDNDRTATDSWIPHVRKLMKSKWFFCWAAYRRAFKFKLHTQRRWKTVIVNYYVCVMGDAAVVDETQLLNSTNALAKVSFTGRQPSVEYGLLANLRKPWALATCVPTPIHNIKPRLVTTPIPAPYKTWIENNFIFKLMDIKDIINGWMKLTIEFAQGKKMPNVKTPRRGPPMIPKILKAA